MDGGDTPTLEEALKQLGLDTLVEIFTREQVDYDSLVRIHYCISYACEHPVHVLQRVFCL